jgi:hypothetical protein
MLLVVGVDTRRRFFDRKRPVVALLSWSSKAGNLVQLILGDLL